MDFTLLIDFRNKLSRYNLCTTRKSHWRSKNEIDNSYSIRHITNWMQ